MPFQKGNQLAIGNKGGGRKGYEWEEKQKEQMQDLTSQFLDLSEKIMNKKAVTEEVIAFERMQNIMAKIIDKLHASKQYIEQDLGGETLEELTQILKKIATI